MAPISNQAGNGSDGGRTSGLSQSRNGVPTAPILANGHRNANGDAHGDARPASDRSEAIIRLDNLMRHRLHVTDPRDPAEVARALGQRYPTETARLTREILGLQVSADPTPLAPSATPAIDEHDGAIADAVERDIESLMSDSNVAEIRAELRGWVAAIRSFMSAGLASAANALDPRDRERVLSCRRGLTDYSRLARFCGALNPPASANYRQFAFSLDRASSLMLVRLGSAAASFTVGMRSLPIVPATDLQSHREIVLESLRSLLGAGPTAGSADGWPRGTLAERQVAEHLRSGGYNDLNALLDETNLGQLLDALIDASALSSTTGGSGMAATQLRLDALRRLVFVCKGSAKPRSPHLEAFRVSLQRLLDMFDRPLGANVARLASIARPPLLLELQSDGDSGAETLGKLAGMRSAFARVIEGAGAAGQADDARTKLQAQLDACLQYFDTAMDLYLVGDSASSTKEPEKRASAAGFIAHSVRVQVAKTAPGAADVVAQLQDMRDLLLPGGRLPRRCDYVIPVDNDRVEPMFRATVGRELTLIRGSERRLFEVVRRLSPSLMRWSRASVSPLEEIIKDAVIQARTAFYRDEYKAAVPRDVAVALEEHWNM